MVALENGAMEVAQAQNGLASLSVATSTDGVGPGAMVPVGEVRSVLPSPDLSSVQAVETQTKAIGVIYPPPDIRAIVDKAANFVAKNGEAAASKQARQQHVEHAVHQVQQGHTRRAGQTVVLVSLMHSCMPLMKAV